MPLTEGVRRYSVAHFLAALILLLLAMPFVEEFSNGGLFEAVLVTTVLLTGVLAVGGRRRSLVVATVLVVPAVLGTWLHHIQPAAVPSGLGLAPAILFAAFVISHLLLFILRAEHVTSEVLCAAIANYLMLGVLWAMAYELVWRISPASFQVNPAAGTTRSMDGFDALYFSFAALAPINDNDISPVSNVARLLVMVEATVGILYISMLIARLVGMYSNEQPADS